MRKRCYLILGSCFLSLWKSRKHHPSEDSDLYQVALASGNLSDCQQGKGQQSPERGLDPYLQRGPGEWAHRGGGSSLRYWPGQDHCAEDSRAQGGSGEVLQRWWQGWKDHPEPAGEYICWEWKMMTTHRCWSHLSCMRTKRLSFKQYIVLHTVLWNAPLETQLTKLSWLKEGTCCSSLNFPDTVQVICSPPNTDH